MANSTGEHPNILLLINDHQAYYRHGWDHGPLVQRPNFDRLVGEGVLFERAYCASPLCSPARRTIFTGVYPHRHGEIKNDVDHPWDREPVFTELGRLGYRNLYYGKWHCGPGTAADRGCVGVSYPSYNNPYTKPEYKRYLEDNGLPAPEILIENSFERGDGLIPGRLYRQERNWCNEHASGILQTPKETHDAFYVASLARDQIRTLANEPDSRPFCMVVSFWGPHQPYFPSADFAALYNPGDIPEYGSFSDNLSGKPEVHWSEGNAGISENGKLIVPNPLPWSEWQQVLARCYAQITLVDAAGGMVLDTLEECGLSDNTLVMWTADHGDAIASHGGHFDKRSYLSEEMVRVPLGVRWPTRIQGGQKRRELVSHVDLKPTILEAVGSAAEEGDGSSLLGLLSGGKTWRTDVLCETHGHAENVFGRCVVSGRYKYAYYEGMGAELYDLVLDPFELTNLMESPAHSTVQVRMRDRLALWQERTFDRQATEGRAERETP